MYSRLLFENPLPNSEVKRAANSRITSLPYCARSAPPCSSSPMRRPVIVDTGRGHPGVDAVLDPDRDGDGADASSLPFKVGQDPAALPLLDGLDIELGQLVAPQGAAHQQRQDDVIAFALQGGAVRD